MTQKFVNNFESELASNVAVGATTLELRSGDGAKLPVITAPDYLLLTLERGTRNEIVKVTAHAANSDTCTIVKAQESTSDYEWLAGDVVEARLTAASLQDIANAVLATIFDGKGDLIVGSAADTPARLAVGTDGWVLRAASGESTGLVWSPLSLPARASSATETLTANDTGKCVVTATASTLTLPLLSAVRDGALIAVSLNAAAVVNIQRQGTDELSWNRVASLNSIRMTQYGDYIVLVADTGASRWRVVSENIHGPYFEAQYEGAAFSIGTNTATKLPFNVEASDSHDCYDPTTNYRFTPTIPGWYAITASCYLVGSAATRGAAILYKNGVFHEYGNRFYTTNDGVFSGSWLVYFNGSTDYAEVYGITVDAAGNFDDVIESNFKGVRIR